jgi:hypothetical protein
LIAVVTIPGLTLFRRISYVFANELDDPIGNGNTLLDREDASDHINEHGIERFFPDELYAPAVRVLFDELGTLHLYLADRDDVFLVRREGLLRLAEDGGNER